MKERPGSGTRALAAVALIAATWLGARPYALQGEAPGDAMGGEETAQIERLTKWPALENAVRRRLATDVARLRKARTDTMVTEARAALTAVGAGAVPALVKALGKEKDPAARARIETVLERITGAPHTRLLAAYFSDRSPAVRTWALRRVARFPDPGTRRAAQAAWARIGARTKKAKKDRESAEEKLAAALALVASGSPDGLDHLLARARKSWKTIGPAVRAATEGVRGEKATSLLLPHLDGERAERIAVLRLLAGCGVEERAVARIRPFLDAEDVGIRGAAINALRGIVDGDPPLATLSAFDAIERAKKWKRRI